MDRVRLGRVLGRGARMAARTVYEAVDAATTPGAAPNAARTPAPAASHSAAEPARAPATHPVNAPAALSQAVRTAGRVHSSARAARQGVLAPVKRASRAVTLQITGSFFSLFALSFAAALWRFRAAWRNGAEPRMWLYFTLCALFAYFAISNFLRARKLSR